MKHVSRSFYGSTLALWLLALSGSISASAQQNPVRSPEPSPGKSFPLLTSPVAAAGQSTSTDRPAVAAFRRSLKLDEIARQKGITTFLARNVRVIKEYTDVKGGYHFLHHIDQQGKPVYYQTRSNLGLATSINTSKLWQGGSLGLNLQGQGMEVSQTRSRLGMWEPGALRASHREFTGRAITRDTPVFNRPGGNADHATHVAGTMMAAGLNLQARGMANQARLDCYEIQTDEKEEMLTAASEGMLVSNHSYGPSFDSTRVKLGVYDEQCKAYDNITFLNKNYLQFHAAGNDRNDEGGITYDILVGSVNAKNVATVGAVRRLEGGYKGPASVVIADFSSYGPTDDGRIKPDFVAPGVDILSAYSASDTTYRSIQGTSMASPGAAGSLFLLQQHYRNIKNTFMRAATLKGLAIHTASEAGRNPGPDYEFGWGLLNLKKAIDLINHTGGLQVMEETSLANGATYIKTVTTAGGPFKTTICWTDVPGTPLVNGGRDNRTPMLVNDLDIRLIDMATNQPVAQLPWKLNPATPTAAATRGDNVVDNMEQIFVENLPAGQYMIRVTHKGTLQQGPQEFSLFVSSIATGGPIVKVNSTDPTSTEGNATTSSAKASRARTGATAADPGFIQFERSNTTGPLVVNYQVGGTATNGTDFATLPTSVTFADGQSVLIEEIDPIEDDLIEGDESIIITLLDDDAYDPDPDNETTTVTIRDKAPSSLTITSFNCFSTNGALSSVDFVVGYANGTFAPALPALFVNGVTASGQLGTRYTFSGFDGNAQPLAVKDNATRSTYFVWNFRAACATPAPPVQPTSPATLTVTSYTCTTTNSVLTSVDFVVGYANGSISPALPPLFINGVTASGQLGTRYTFGGFDGNAQPLSIQDNATRSTYFVWNFRAACASQPSPSRLSAESVAPLQVSVLGNPVTDHIEVAITGVEGHTLYLSLTDNQGHTLEQRSIDQPASVERQRFDVRQKLAGLLLLRATSGNQTQTIKVLKK